ncbi:glycoside hydrolase domain-containing protein [Kribbella sp. NPDC051718]|uniref:glycoside hydrolase domain-containing protein n=1 Tax=Kribbella sp. NPDC051718 TaxID=3155168 RepID=UPI00343853FF
MDVQVLAAQQWLNATYGSVNGWVHLDEDGQTAWSVMYGLRRGLQTELGISPVTSGFGPATTAAFISQIGRIDGSTTKVNVLKLLSAAMWCKGYPGFYAGNEITFANLSNAVGWMRNDLGLGLDNPFVDVKLMASLMSMDAYVKLGPGTNQVREVQRWLNATYLSRRDFALVPCDGIYSRSVQTALTYGLQYEIGLADGVATGNFGPGTRDGIRTQGIVSQGSVDGAKRFVRLYQAVLRFNRYDSPFNGTFDGDTAQFTRDFQGFMELPVNGNGDYSTWCALLVSCGDTTIATKGFDTNKQLTAAQANGAVAAGYTTIGRYTVGAGKFITAPELDLLKAAGLKLFPIHQRYNDTPAVMTRANGSLHGVEALERCRVLGLPAGSVVFFSVDFDAVGEVINGPVADYFRGVNDSMDDSVTGKYKIGVYGTRNVCSIILENDLAEAAFVAGMSTGYSGNMGFPMPENWHYNQIVEIQAQLPGVPTALGIDKDVVSSHATPIDLGPVVSPPIERDGSTSGTGFDAFFEWLVRAEVACERGLVNASTLLKNLRPYAPFTRSFVAHWLQKPEYWSGSSDGQWNLYTPTLDTGDLVLARAAAEEELNRLTPNKPVSNRDIAHFAATVRGYEVWDVPTTQNDYGLGDLGGWCLDLLSTWGAYEKARQQTPTLDLRQYLVARIGVRNADGNFPWADVVADSDGYLVARAMKDGHLSMSEALRGLLKLTDKQRVAKFYQDRFGSVELNVVTAFKKLADGIDVGPVENFPLTNAKLIQAAKAETLPSPADATVCAEVYARMMAAQG